MISTEKTGTENAVAARSLENLVSTSEACTGVHPTKDIDQAKDAPDPINNSSSTPAHKSAEVDEKVSRGGTTEEADNVVESSAETTEGEDEATNIVYPSGIPLALLTFVCPGIPQAFS